VKHDDASVAVLVWWAALALISIVNIVWWAKKVRVADDRRQLWLSGVYVFVCAFRSFLPRADVQRICFVDSIWASVFVGRSLATVAELCFVVQLALTARAIARALDLPSARFVATLPLFLIPVAEGFSWYAVVTTNYLGNFVEQSLWTVSGALFAVSLILLLPRAHGALRRLLGLSLVGSIVYVVFMLTVDLRMYFVRLTADRLQGRSYLSFGAGMRDLLYRRVVTFAWSDWHDELAWMFLYFSVSVWFSLSLISAARHWRVDGRAVRSVA
jgi:hypothetical protein